MDKDKLAEFVVDAIISATTDRIDEMNATQGRYAAEADDSRATAIEAVVALLSWNEQAETATKL